MAVIALVSGKGSPGVTTTMVALTRAWHAATGRVAFGLDLDPCGGDVAAGALLGSVTPGSGVLALATDRSDDPAGAVRAAAVPVSADGSSLVPGVPDAARAGAIPLAWDVISAARHDLDVAGIDLLLDSGRLGGADPSPPWLPEVDRGVLVVRPALPWVASARRVAESWPDRTSLSVLVVASPSPYSAREVARAIDRPLLDELPFDSRAAAVHSEGARPDRRHARGSYARAVQRLATELTPSEGIPIGRDGGDRIGDAPATAQGLGS